MKETKTNHLNNRKGGDCAILRKKRVGRSRWGCLTSFIVLTEKELKESEGREEGCV
jgi:hypothetical protein